MAIAPEEARKIKDLITQFLYATHGTYNVSSVGINRIKKEKSQIEISGKFDAGGLLEVKMVYFTVILDAQYRLISYERTDI